VTIKVQDSGYESDDPVRTIEKYLRISTKYNWKIFNGTSTSLQ